VFGFHLLHNIVEGLVLIDVFAAENGLESFPCLGRDSTGVVTLCNEPGHGATAYVDASNAWSLE
jgi:hypothetical protein